MTQPQLQYQDILTGVLRKLDGQDVIEFYSTEAEVLIQKFQTPRYQYGDLLATQIPANQEIHYQRRALAQGIVIWVSSIDFYEGYRRAS